MSRQNKRKACKAGIPWEELRFVKIKTYNKTVAKCLICQEIRTNIGYKRLLGHRYVNNLVKNGSFPYLS